MKNIFTFNKDNFYTKKWTITAEDFANLYLEQQISLRTLFKFNNKNILWEDIYKIFIFSNHLKAKIFLIKINSYILRPSLVN